MAVRHSLVRGAAAALLAGVWLAQPAAAQEQQPAEFGSWKIPGWSFTPGVAIGAVFDSNVAIAGPDPNGKTASDKLMEIQPSGLLEFFTARTSFSSGYNGAWQRYLQLSALDTTEHRAFFTLRHRLSRRVTIFADDNFNQLPTTDLLELNGVPFARVGSRYNNGGAGVDARLTKTLDLTATYDMSWVDFLDKTLPLTGGLVHDVRSGLTHRFNERLSAGGEYGFRWADLNDGARQFSYQDVGGVVTYRSGERTRLEFAAGMSHLTDRGRDLTRTSPYARAAITHRLQRAVVGGEYRRSYTPSFYLGGSHQSQDLRGYVDMPFNRNRLYLQESAVWRRTEPLVDLEPALDSIYLRSTLGYVLQRWLRVEAFHTYTTQDNRLAGGRITRHVAGAQLVVSEPMRIR